MLVSYSSIDPRSSSVAKKVKDRPSSSNRRPTLSCNAGYIDHDVSEFCAFGFGFLRDLGCGADMLNNLSQAYM